MLSVVAVVVHIVDCVVKPRGGPRIGGHPRKMYYGRERIACYSAALGSTYYESYE